MSGTDAATAIDLIGFPQTRERMVVVVMIVYSTFYCQHLEPASPHLKWCTGGALHNSHWATTKLVAHTLTSLGLPPPSSSPFFCLPFLPPSYTTPTFDCTQTVLLAFHFVISPKKLLFSAPPIASHSFLWVGFSSFFAKKILGPVVFLLIVSVVPHFA